MTSRGTSNSPATKPGDARVAGGRYSGRSAHRGVQNLESSPSPAYGAVLEWQLGSNALEGSNPSDSAISYGIEPSGMPGVWCFGGKGCG